MDAKLKVLVLCTGNSCRSIMAEALINHLGGGRFQGFSAGSRPTGHVHPQSLATLKRHGISANGYRSKSWNEFSEQPLDIVITVCDSAANESCPVFLGVPLRAHWGTPDPAHFEGSKVEVEAEFERVFQILKSRVQALVNLPVESMKADEIQRKVNEIAQR